MEFTEVKKNGFEISALDFIAERISIVLRKMRAEDFLRIEEIRLRANKPLMIQNKNGDFFVDAHGNLSIKMNNSFIVEKSDLDKTLLRMSDYSLYSVEEELRQGFITLKGGHRVGLTGKTVADGNNIRTIKNISGMNIRIAKEVKGCAYELVKKAFTDNIKHTLIISPPGCGKTTMLRDLIRILSDGDEKIRIKGYRIGLVDERGEVSACYQGIPQLDVGIRTDVLDSCPKTEGVYMLIRSMNPEIIAVDEVGSVEDAKVLDDALNTGIKIIATAHGNDLEDIKRRHGLRNMVENTFEQIIILSRRRGPGTIEDIIQL